MSLIRQNIERPSLIGINSSVVHKIEIVLEKNIFQTCKNVKWFFPHQSEKRRRCNACVSKIKAGAKEKKISKQLSQCQKCTKLLCNKHLICI